MKLDLKTLMQILQMAPQVVGLSESIVALVHAPHVTVLDSAGQPVSPTVIADLVSVATASAVAGVQSAG